MSAPSHEASAQRSYERPNEKWVCGLTAGGHPCPFGPGPGGQCGARPECAPRRQGDRWQCTRPESRGGPCADGPLPDGTCGRPVSSCQPARGLRSRRGQLAFCAVALSLGVVLFLVGGPSRPAFLSPGPLTFEHGTVTQSCEACHGVPEERLSALFVSAVSPHGAGAQNQRCLECHHLGEHGSLPHGLPAGRLEELTREARGQPSNAPLLLAAAKHGLGVPRAADGSLACGGCHREHQGEQFNLRSMDNERCQACHVRQFAGLADGHPEFSGYPYHRRTAVFFDHESHMGRHFKDFARTMPGGKAPDSCIDCHTPDPAGRMMLVRNFDQTCASCHLPQIVDDTLGGVRFLNIPSVDVATLREHERVSSYVEPMTALCALPGLQSSLALPLAALFRDGRLVVQPPFAVGEWPVQASGPPTPILQLLLSADPRYAALREPLRRADLTDLRRATPEQVRAAAALVWGTKELIYDIIRDGDGAIKSRINKVAQPPLSQEQLMLMAGDLPPSLVGECQQRWLPALLAEVPAWRAGRPLPDGGGAAAGTPTATPHAAGRWHAQDADCSLQYVLRRHTDLFLRAWLDVSGEKSAGPRGAVFSAVFDNMADPDSPGRCIKCHSVDEGPNRERRVQWWPAGPVPDDHPFTTFAHGPHFDLLGGHRCATCHTLAVDSKYQASYLTPEHALRTDGAGYASNFAPIEKATCVACHTARQAGDGCLVCHNYHVGRFSPFHAPRQPLQGFPSRPRAERRQQQPAGPVRHISRGRIPRSASTSRSANG